MNINEIIHKTLMVGIGVPEKIKELVDELVKKGELSESQGARLVKECSEKVARSGEDISKAITDIINKTLEKMNIPTRDEVDELKKKLRALSTRVKKLEDASKGSES
ncbi:MAG: hypothetical protein GXP46_08105 [Deferribacteres bacterium]|nr:hypothetical protein [Deferribacteres bacterium]